MTRFYSTNIHENIILLEENDSRHAIKSLRLKNDDCVNVINGHGVLYTAQITDAHPKKTILKIIKEATTKEEVPLILAFAPTKNNDRNEWIIEKGVEIGMTSCYPIITQNSERRKWNIERIKKISISAMKQSGRTWLPEIHNPLDFDSFLSLTLPKIKLIAHCRKDDKTSIGQVKNNLTPQLILIGPEGDFTETEIQQALKRGFNPVSIGNNRLRTETACIAALSVLKTD